MAQDPPFAHLNKLNTMRFAAISCDPKSVSAAFHEVADLFQDLISRLERIESALKPHAPDK